MNKLNFNQSIGFPFETNILDQMQTSYNIFNAFGAIIGNFSIVSGCELVGTTVADGVVFINGETLAFKGGVAQDNVIIVETKQALEFEDGNSRDVIFIRYATFGTATTQYPWTTFKRGFETKEIPAELSKKEDKTTVDALIARIIALEARPSSGIPIGMIAIWGREANLIPKGWKPYDLLKGRVPIGFDKDDPDFQLVGKISGAKNKKLEISEIPEHAHESIEWSGGKAVNTAGKGAIASGGHIATGEYNEGKINMTSSIGKGHEFSIMNPYAVVHFIEYVG